MKWGSDLRQVESAVHCYFSKYGPASLDSESRRDLLKMKNPRFFLLYTMELESLGVGLKDIRTEKPPWPGPVTLQQKGMGTLEGWGRH